MDVQREAERQIGIARQHTLKIDDLYDSQRELIYNIRDLILAGIDEGYYEGSVLDSLDDLTYDFLEKLEDLEIQLDFEDYKRESQELFQKLLSDFMDILAGEQPLSKSPAAFSL